MMVILILFILWVKCLIRNDLIYLLVIFFIMMHCWRWVLELYILSFNKRLQLKLVRSFLLYFLKPLWPNHPVHFFYEFLEVLALLYLMTFLFQFLPLQRLIVLNYSFNNDILFGRLINCKVSLWPRIHLDIARLSWLKGVSSEERSPCLTEEACLILLHRNQSFIIIFFLSSIQRVKQV